MTTLEALRSAVTTSSGQEIAIATLAARDLPGYAVDVVLRAPTRVRIDYRVGWLDEGEARFQADYPTFEHAVAAIETWLERPLSTWDPALPIVAVVVARCPSSVLSASHQELQRRIASGRVALPGGARFSLRSAFWTGFDTHRHYP